jgi:hypothetical protein
MNRMHPGKPPSERRPSAWSGDWRERLHTTTQSLATKMRDTFGFDDPSTRRILIAAVRIALSETPTKDLESAADADELEGAIAVTAQAYRIILDGDRIDRNSPIIAESFMVIVERALDDLGFGWLAKIRKTVQMNLAIEAQLNGHYGTEARTKILEYVHEALGDTASDDFTIFDPNPNDRGEDEQLMMSMPGSFRIVLDSYDLDYHQPTIRDAVVVAVVAALDAELPESPSSK